MYSAGCRGDEEWKSTHLGCVIPELRSEAPQANFPGRQPCTHHCCLTAGTMSSVKSTPLAAKHRCVLLKGVEMKRRGAGTGRATESQEWLRASWVGAVGRPRHFPCATSRSRPTSPMTLAFCTCFWSPPLAHEQRKQVKLTAVKKACWATCHRRFGRWSAPGLLVGMSRLWSVWESVALYTDCRSRSQACRASFGVLGP